MKYNWILVLARIRGMDKEILFINEFQQSVLRLIRNTMFILKVT